MFVFVFVFHLVICLFVLQDVWDWTIMNNPCSGSLKMTCIPTIARAMLPNGIRRCQDVSGKKHAGNPGRGTVLLLVPIHISSLRKKTQTITCNLRLKLENLRHPGHPSLFEVPVQHVDENHQPKNNARTIIWFLHPGQQSQLTDSSSLGKGHHKIKIEWNHPKPDGFFV